MHDSTLATSAECIWILLQMSQLALVRWSQLYDVSGQKKLTAAIARELSEQHAQVWAERRRRRRQEQFII